jgi:hypothetical protein
MVNMHGRCKNASWVANLADLDILVVESSRGLSIRAGFILQKGI